MASNLNPYVNFRGKAREALDFYASVFGGTPVINTFGQYGDPAAANADLVMHGQLETPMGFVLMCADAPDEMPMTVGDNVTISLSGDDAEALRGYWARLSEGGQVSVPLEKQMWGDEFGMCSDQFGIPWMVNVTEG